MIFMMYCRKKNRKNDEKVSKLMKWLSFIQGIKVMEGKGCKSNESHGMIFIFSNHENHERKIMQN